MSNYHGEIMNLTMVDDISIAEIVTEKGTMEPSAVRCYKLGHRDARHAAAEIANEADRRIAELETQLAAAKDGLTRLQIFATDLHDIACNGHLDPDLLAMRGVSWATGSYRVPSPEEVTKAYEALERSGD